MKIRKFKSGAIRDNEDQKEDYIETISWSAMKRYAKYMTDCKKKYGEGNCYEVIRHNEDMLTFSLKPTDISKNMKTLYEGDLITFTEKRHRGRPRKTQY